MFNMAGIRMREGIRTEALELREKNLEFLGKTLKEGIDRCFRGSLAIREVDGGSCNACEYEIASLLNPYYDLTRFGIQFTASPKHADVLMITGCFTRHLREAVVKTYENIPEPKFVIAVGDCAMDGGEFRGGYAVLDGVRDKLPVNLWIRGCPPEPIDLLSGLVRLINGPGPR